MPRVPKYSTRINLIFLSRGLKIPLKSDGFWDTVRFKLSKLSTNLNQTGGFLLTSSIELGRRESLKISRHLNIDKYNETDPKTMESLTEAVDSGITRIKKVFETEGIHCRSLRRGLMFALTETIQDFNRIFASIHGTWLQGVGLLSESDLYYFSPLEFWREVKPILPKILGRDFDSVWERIMKVVEALPDASLIDSKVAMTIRNLARKCS